MNSPRLISDCYHLIGQRGRLDVLLTENQWTPSRSVKTYVEIEFPRELAIYELIHSAVITEKRGSRRSIISWNNGYEICGLLRQGSTL